MEAIIVLVDTRMPLSFSWLHSCPMPPTLPLWVPWQAKLVVRRQPVKGICHGITIPVYSPSSSRYSACCCGHNSLLICLPVSSRRLSRALLVNSPFSSAWASDLSQTLSSLQLPSCSRAAITKRPHSEPSCVCVCPLKNKTIQDGNEFIFEFITRDSECNISGFYIIIPLIAPHSAN